MTERTGNRQDAIAASDLERFRAGTHAGLGRLLGAHPAAAAGATGLRFAVWVPGAAAVQATVAGESGEPAGHPLSPRADGSGIWEGFVPGAFAGKRFLYQVTDADATVHPGQGDPFSFPATDRGGHGSTAVWPVSAPQAGADAPGPGPLAIYQVRLDGWRRVPEEENRPLHYGEAAGWLTEHLRWTGFTHVELLRTPEAPEIAGLGRTGFFAPPGGQGDAADFAALVQILHDAGAGLLLQRTVAPEELGLLERPETRAIFLSASAAWLEAGVDGLRLELPLGADGGLAPPAARFFELLEAEIAAHHPGALLILGGPGSAPRAIPPGARPRTLLWRSDWEGRTREYFAIDPIHRSHRHELLVQGVEETRGAPALLPLSCDGGTPAGSSLLAGLWGDERQRLAHLRLLLGYAWMCPGAKLLGMGGEFGQWGPLRPDGSLDWHLTGAEPHHQVQRWVAHLNILYRGEPALAGGGPDGGFAWVDAADREQSVLCFERFAPAPAATLLAVCNFTPVPRTNYRVGAPRGGCWDELLNSDAGVYGGWGMGNLGSAEASPVPYHGRHSSLSLILPPLSILVLRSSAA